MAPAVAEQIDISNKGTQIYIFRMHIHYHMHNMNAAAHMATTTTITTITTHSTLTDISSIVSWTEVAVCSSTRPHRIRVILIAVK
jgi:hypothetical protein